MLTLLRPDLPFWNLHGKVKRILENDYWTSGKELRLNIEREMLFNSDGKNIYCLDYYERMMDEEEAGSSKVYSPGGMLIESFCLNKNKKILFRCTFSYHDNTTAINDYDADDNLIKVTQVKSELASRTQNETYYSPQFDRLGRSILVFDENNTIIFEEKYDAGENLIFSYGLNHDEKT